MSVLKILDVLMPTIIIVLSTSLARWNMSSG